MTNSQGNKRTMYEATLALLSDNGTLTGTIPAFADALTEFRNVVAEIDSKSVEIEQATTGKVAAKNQAAEELVNAVVPVASALVALAREIKDAELKEKGNVTPTSLKNMRPGDLVVKATAIYDIATQRKDELVPYSVTQEKLVELQAKLTGYNTATGEKESSGAEKSGARARLVAIYTQADEVLYDVIDNLMEQLKPSQREFYNKYKSARVIKDLGVRHMIPKNGGAEAPQSAATELPKVA